MLCIYALTSFKRDERYLCPAVSSNVDLCQFIPSFELTFPLSMHRFNALNSILFVRCFVRRACVMCDVCPFVLLGRMDV